MKTHLKTHKSGLKIEFSQDFKSLNPISCLYFKSVLICSVNQPLLISYLFEIAMDLRRTSTLIPGGKNSQTPKTKLLKRGEIEEWFAKNLRSVEAAKFMKAKDKFL